MVTERQTGMIAAYYRCLTGHDEVRWARPDGESCWMCGAPGRPFAAIVITAIDAMVRDLDGVVFPEAAA